MNKGKEKCETLRNLRRLIAEKYNLKYEPTECHHEGDCPGTCPVCDKELQDLQRQLDKKGITDLTARYLLTLPFSTPKQKRDGVINIDREKDLSSIIDEEQLGGIPAYPEELEGDTSVDNEEIIDTSDYISDSDDKPYEHTQGMPVMDPSEYKNKTNKKNSNALIKLCRKIRNLFKSH